VPMLLSVALLVMWLVLSQQQSGQLAQLGALEQEIRQLAVRPVHQDRVTPAKPEKTLAIDIKTAQDEPVELAALWQQLPAFADLSPRMMHIASLAQKRQIALNVGDYQWQAHQATSATQARSATQNIQQFDMRFTIQADYATCRQFMMDVLKQYPSMALTGLELRKNETVQPVIDATLTFSVFIRGGHAHGA